MKVLAWSGLYHRSPGDGLNGALVLISIVLFPDPPPPPPPETSTVAIPALTSIVAETPAPLKSMVVIPSTGVPPSSEILTPDITPSS